MNEQDQYTDLFDQYTQDKLREPERVAFEKRLFSDKDFGDAYRIYSSLVDGIREHGRLELKNYLKQHGKVKQPRTVSFMRTSYLAAASVILLLGIGGVIYFNTRPQYAPEMASQEIQPDFKDVPLGDSMRMVPEYVQRAGRLRPDEENEQEMISPESHKEELDLADVSAGTVSSGAYAEKSEIAPDPPMTADDIYPVLSEKRLKDTIISAPVLIVFLDDREKETIKAEDVAIMKKDSKSVEWKSTSKQKSSQNPGIYNNNANVSNNNAGYSNRADSVTAVKKGISDDKSDLSKKQLQVEFWKSPVNFRGYSYIGNKIILYSVSQTSARIFVVNEKTYLRTEGIVYLLEPCSNTCDFKSETNITITNFILQQP